MKKISLISIFVLLFLYQCSNEKKNITNNNLNELSYVGGERDKVNEELRLSKEKMWEEANRYKAAITDTTFLQTKGKMSEMAINPFTGNGQNQYYALNQVVYLKALERVKKHLFIKDSLLVCDLKSGVEIRISEDLFQYIMDLLKNWNLGIKEGKYKIVKTKNNSYDIEAIPQ